MAGRADLSIIFILGQKISPVTTGQQKALTHKESVTGDCKNGRIPIRSLEKFMRNVEKLLNKKGANLIPGHNSCDDPGYVLNLFERVIEWAYSDTENNPDLKKLQLIVDEFIKKCDKEY